MAALSNIPQRPVRDALAASRTFVKVASTPIAGYARQPALCD
jgi:hypothetical protein